MLQLVPVTAADLRLSWPIIPTLKKVRYSVCLIDYLDNTKHVHLSYYTNDYISYIIRQDTMVGVQTFGDYHRTSLPSIRRYWNSKVLNHKASKINVSQGMYYVCNKTNEVQNVTSQEN